MLKLAINGADGKMGCELINCIQSSQAQYQLSLARVFSGTGANWTPPYVHELPLDFTQAEVLIDFSNHTQMPEVVKWCTGNKIPLVLGTTGFSLEEMAIIRQSAAHIPIVYSANMSLSVNVLLEAVKMVAGKLANYEVEIIESHHRYKKDAPSGTAIGIGKVVAEARGEDFEQVACYNRIGNNNPLRKASEIGFSVIRGGDIVGKHVVDFISDGEELTISSVINSRKSFALGALTAAKFVVNQHPGLYSMQDVLGLK